MKRLLVIIGALFIGFGALAQSYPSPTFQDVNARGAFKINGANVLSLVGGVPDLPSLRIAAPANVSAYTKGLVFPNATNPVTVNASQQLDHVRISQEDGSANQYTVAASGIVSGFNYQMTSLAGSDASSNIYGVIGDVINSGPGTVKGVYGRATCGPGATGVCIALVGGITSSATSGTTWGQQISLDTYTNAGAVPVDAGVHIGSNVSGNQSKLNYGLFLSNDIAIQPGGAGFQMSAQGPGDFAHLLNSGLSSYLFQVQSTGGTGIGMAAGDFGFAEKLSVKGFGAFGTPGTLSGIVGDTGSGNFVVGSQTNSPIELRVNATPSAYVTSSGLSLSSGNFYQINGTSVLSLSGSTPTLPAAAKVNDASTSYQFQICSTDATLAGCGYIGANSAAPFQVQNPTNTGQALMNVTTGGVVNGLGGLSVAGVTAVDSSGGHILQKKAVASLPTCDASTEGTLYAVTDASSATFNAALAGGGTNHVMGYCNGTGWTVH